MLYCRDTVILRSAGGRRRWRLAIAYVAVLGIFTAVTTGWALRSANAVAAPPQPAAWTHATPYAGLHVGRAQFAVDSQPVRNGVSLLSQGYSPTNHGPTKNAWMTRDRPPNGARVAPPRVWSPWPVSLSLWETALFGPLGSETSCARPAAAIAGQDILTELCVARR